MKEKLHRIFADNKGDVSQETLLRYVNGSATAEEQRWIEERMSDDPFLSDAVEGMMKACNPEKIKEHLEVIHQEIKIKSSGKVRKLETWKRWLQVAAALVVLTSSIWFINNRIQRSSEKIFTEEFDPYPVPEKEVTPPENANTKTTDEQAFIPPSEQITPARKEVNSTENATTLREENIRESKPEESETSSGYNKEEIESTFIAPEEAQSADFALTEIEKNEYALDSVQTKSTAPATGKYDTREPSLVAPQSMSEVTIVQEKKSTSDAFKIKKDTDQKNAMLEDALDWYHQGNFQEAISRFELALVEDANNDAANFYAGVSYLAVNDADKALDKLKRLDNKKEGAYYEAALWYESLAYVQKNEKKNAISVLEKVVKLNGEHRAKAEELLGQLR